MPPHTSIDQGDAWLDTEPLRLRDDVEIITGAGGRTMLVPRTGKFLSISASGVSVVRRLGDGMTGRALIKTLTAEHPDQATSILTVVPAFLTDLRQASALTVDPEPFTRTEKFTRLGKADPVKRFPLLADPGRYAAPVARLLAHLPAWLLCSIVLVIPLACLPLLVVALTTATPLHAPTLAVLVAVLGVMICEIVLHECCHAIAMAYNDVRAKNAGIGLLFFFLPVAYVDRTDSYRHQGRLGRVLISLIGPISDLFWAGVSSVVIISTSGPTSTFFHLLLLLQIFSLVANLNPLFPSDGYHALEAALGSINMRGRALTFVLHKLSGRPLPTYLQRTAKKVRAGYVAYAAVSLLYTLLVVLAVGFNLLALAVRFI